MGAEQRVDAFIAAMNDNDVTGACAMLAEAVVYYNIPFQPVEGRAAAEAVLTGMGPMKSIDWEVLNSVAAGDTVCNERIDRFEFADGRTAAVRVMGIFRVADDEIVEWRDYFDPAEFAPG
ncbi:MAG: limonene-1,2-epoxide hydrolase family protein [Pseudomonadota bacterium]